MNKVLFKFRLYAFPIFIGSVLFGISVNMFLLPHGIVTGGATGIATAAGKLWGIPVGLGIVLVNLPIFAVCIKQSGIGGMIYAIIGTLTSSIAIDLLYFLPCATDDPLLSSLIGGAVMGAGSGTMIVSGFTTGGTDLAAYLVHKRHPSLSTGRMILFFDAAVITLSALALRNFAGIMYSAICTVTYSAALDMVQSTSKRARMIFVISDHSEDMAKNICEKIDRGVTLLSGKGYFSGSDKNIIMCVVGKHEEFGFCKLVLETDPAAFIIIGEAVGVTGKGFS